MHANRVPGGSGYQSVYHNADECCYEEQKQDKTQNIGALPFLDGAFVLEFFFEERVVRAVGGRLFLQLIHKSFN